MHFLNRMHPSRAEFHVEVERYHMIQSSLKVLCL